MGYVDRVLVLEIAIASMEAILRACSSALKVIPH